MTTKRYLGWTWILSFSAASVLWSLDGRAFVRRTFYAPVSVDESARTQHQFLAVVFPRISNGGERATMDPTVLDRLLTGLRSQGYVSIGLDDVRQFYRRHRPLPPKAILLGFADDYPRGVELADEALRRARMRGVLFLTGIAAGPELDQRRFLSPHALGQLLKGGAWDFGAISRETPTTDASGVAIDALLDTDGRQPWPIDYSRYPFRFVASEYGLNDSRDDLRALHVMTVHPEDSPKQMLRIVDESWSRSEAFVDDFSRADMLDHWVVGWGIVASSRRRLLLLPTPRQTGAGVFLRGTDKWRDLSLEFELKKFESEFWAYARYQDAGSFIRIGSRDGYWYVEQKTGARNKPRMLARTPLGVNPFPAKVRIIVKGDSALVYVNGRMQFGRALHVSPEVSQGRVLLAVYDLRPRSAMAVLASFKAEPVGADWLALWSNPQGSLAIDANLKELRREAAVARAISPAWLSVRPDGSVARREEQRDLVGSLAGFFHCRLVPIADFSRSHNFNYDRARWGLTEAALEPDVTGLNLKLSDADLRRPKTIAFLKRLTDDFHMLHREVWITAESRPRSSTALEEAVDGTLFPFRALSPDVAVLRAPTKS